MWCEHLPVLTVHCFVNVNQCNQRHQHWLIEVFCLCWWPHHVVAYGIIYITVLLPYLQAFRHQDGEKSKSRLLPPPRRFLGNVINGSRNKCLNFGDVPDPRGTMRFVHLKIKSKDQWLRGFDHNAIFYVMETCSSTAYTTVVSHSMWGKRLFQINCIFFCLQQKICALAI